MPATTHYQLLQVSPRAPGAVIRAAYKALVQAVHPDRHPRRVAWAQAQTVALNEAYAVLSDARQRAYYDASLVAQGRWVDPEAQEDTPALRVAWDGSEPEPVSVGPASMDPAEAIRAYAAWAAEAEPVRGRRRPHACWVHNPTSQHACVRLHDAEGRVVVEGFVPGGQRLKLPLVREAHDLRLQLGVVWGVQGWALPETGPCYTMDVRAASPQWTPMTSPAPLTTAPPTVAAWALDAGDRWALPALAALGFAAGNWPWHHAVLWTTGWALLALALGLRAALQWHRAGDQAGVWPLACAGLVASLGALVPDWWVAQGGAPVNPWGWGVGLMGATFLASALGIAVSRWFPED